MITRVNENFSTYLTAYVQLIGQCTLLVVDLTRIVAGLVDRVHKGNIILIGLIKVGLSRYLNFYSLSCTHRTPRSARPKKYGNLQHVLNKIII
jgi:hypothetical protein